MATDGTIAGLRSPGAPPWGWVARTALILAGTVAFIVALAAAGVVLRGDAGRGFAEGNPGTHASVALLAWSATLAARLWWREGPGPMRWFWAIAAVGLAFLALDDSYELHERLDFAVHDALGWDPEHPVTDKLDDALVGLYGLAGAAAIWWRRRELLRLPWLVYPLAAAGILFVVMVALDIIDRGGMAPEEGTKLLAAACIVSGLYGALLDRGPSAAAASAEPHGAPG